MPTHLNCCGMLWGILSFFGCTASSIGFFLPYWIRGQAEYNGTVVTVYLGLFRRCSYPVRDDNTGDILVVDECGMYSTFLDIPSIWWQLATVITGVGCCCLVLYAFTVMFACCMADVFTRKTARVTGLAQIFAALLVAGGVALYPVGWAHNRDVAQICGPDTGIYKIGLCEISWSFYTCAAGAGLTIISTLLSCIALYDDQYRHPTAA